MIHIRKLSHGVWDVFVGVGWMQWTRVRRVNDNVEFVAGRAPSNFLMKFLKERLVR